MDRKAKLIKAINDADLSDNAIAVLQSALDNQLYRSRKSTKLDGKKITDNTRSHFDVLGEK